MDPLSILGAVWTATDATYKISSTLLRFIQSSRVIDKTLEELNREVEGLTKALETIELSLKDPAISRIKRRKDAKGPWDFLNVAVTDTQRTVNALEGIVEGLGMVKKSANPFKKAVKQVKFNLDADQISEVKDRIHTHTTSLQLALQTASLLISCQSSEGIQRVERLTKAMHLSVQSSRKNATDERLPTRFRNPELLKHTEQLISSASTVLGSRSTAWGGSEVQFPHSSENGQPLDRGQKMTIEDWIPHLASMEEEPPQTSDHHDNSATSDTLVGTDGFNLEEVQSTESDGDDDYDIAKMCFERAKKDFLSDQHVKALESFRAGLKRVERLGLKKKARLELRTIQMRMGLSLLSLGELSESEQCLLSLAWPQTTDDKSKILALHASSGLAQICLCKGSFNEAEDWCNKSRIGWRRIAGKEHSAYITCLRLSALSSELNGNHAEAAAFEELANESKAAPAAVDTELNAYESLGFTMERSRILVSEYQKKVQDTTRKETSTKTRPMKVPDTTKKESSTKSRPLKVPDTTKKDTSTKSRPLKVPDTTKKDTSTKSRPFSPAQQVISDLFNDPPAQILAESPIKSRSSTTAVHKKVPGTMKKEPSTKSTPLSPAKQAFSDPIDGTPAQTLAESPIVSKSETGAIHMKAPDTTRKEASPKSRRPSPAEKPGSNPINEPPAQILVESPVEPKSGTTAVGSLHHAAAELDTALIERLLENGADIEEPAGEDLNRPLHLAALHDNTSAVKCLLDRGANIEAKNQYGNTALLRAAWKGYKSMVMFLLDRGANIKAKNNKGNQALLRAAYKGHKPTVDCLLDRGANIEAANSLGETALLRACHWINEELNKWEIVRTIELLCSRGADVSVKNHKGRSPLTYAREVKDSEIREELVRVLKQYGANE